MTGRSYILQLFIAVGVISLAEETRAYSKTKFEHVIQQDTIPADSVKKEPSEPYKATKTPTYQDQYRFGDPFSNQKANSPLLLADPSTIDLEVEMDTSGVQYNVYERIGETNFRPMTTMSFEEYDAYNDQQITKEYFHERSAGLDGESAVSGRSLIPRLYISPVLDRLFGGSYVDIQPNGFVNLDFGGRFQRNDTPTTNRRQQRYGGFNFDQQISLNLVGKVGEKLQVTANFDNNNTFDFQNNLKIEYTGYEEDIVKKIEIGNVSMPVANSLMTGAQSLFGIKTQLQFGKLYITTVMSRQQGQSEVITVENGFQGKEFEVRGSAYDENRHFFLGHFFRDNYERWHGNLPQIISGVNITRVEVYVINRNNETTTTRQVMAFQDLGEPSKIYHPSINSTAASNSPNNNGANNLYGNIAGMRRNKDEVISNLNELYPEPNPMTESTDFVKIGTARKLEESEYDINKQLGYISLLRKLQNDEMLAVSYEYTYNGQVYKVGEMTEDYSGVSENEVIFMKMLRPNKINTDIPTWNLMMKNIYYLNASQISSDGFTLRIKYRDDATGQDQPHLREGRRTTDIPLLRLLELDQLNPNNDKQNDGNFDFIEGITIDSKSGYILFPVLEPFGSTLNSYFDADEAQFSEKYVFQELYDETQNDAQQISKKDKFFITGKFNAGSSSEIALPGINIAEGSVVVTAGNTPLTEGLDYTVDYNLGRVRILNEGILSSGKTINISYEKADLFNFQARWLYGARFDYQVNENFNIGATIMHLNERRGGVTRYQIGDEPTSNTKYGFDVNYQEEAPFLTKAMDFLPLVSTKEPSTVTINAEFAQLIPATSNVVNGEGTSYIDDFEAAVNNITLDGFTPWKLAAVPSTNDQKFTQSNGTLEENNYRAKLSWYNIDATVFYNSGGVNQPSNIKSSDLANHYERPIRWDEVYTKKSQTNYQSGYQSSFDVAYFPNERGPYNYNTNLGNFENSPERNWGGITRSIGTEVDFEKNNIEYIEFWLMDPFIDGENGRVLDGLYNTNSNPQGGKLVFNLGSVSEDIIPDDRHMFESGMPVDGDPFKVTTSIWGNTPSDPFLSNYFQGNSKSARENQDVGFDGLKDEQEQTIHSAFLSANASRPALSEDPSGDNFRHFLNKEYDQLDAKIIRRYKDFNGTDGNTPVTSSAFPQTGSSTPDNEDMNDDNTVSSLEEYYEYSIDLSSDGLVVGENNIVDAVSQNDGSSWYLFRIPIREWDNSFGGISGYKTIRFMRMYLTGFRTPVVLRMVDLQLVKSAWRKYEGALNETGLNTIPEGSESDFTVSAVNIEANSSGADGKSPYVVPPGLQRDQDNTQFYNTLLNEQSLQVCVEDLEDKDARAVFKNVNFDLLNYGRIKMFFHAESHNNTTVNDDEVTAFLRLGTEQADNFYEIEVPLKITPPNITTTEAASNKRLIWPEENEIDLSIDELLALKSERNKRDIDLSTPFSTTSNSGRYKLTVKGNPDLSTILSMMIGVRNPESTDKADKSVCIWANELRVTDFDTNKGWAANARISTKLADVATINASTRYTSIGFGNIQQTIQQRTREETLGYDVSANVNIDKFLIPHKTGLVVPMFVSFEKTTSTPQFDPLDPDIPLKQSLQAFDTKEEREDYKRLVEDRSERRSINFTNVRKQKVNPDAKQHIYDVENLSFSYTFSEAVSSNINTETYLQRTISGGVAYNYSPIEFRIEPFAKADAFDSPYLQLIKDINFSPLPNSLSFRADLNRNFRMTQLYNDELTTEDVDPYYERLFTFKRSYGLRYTPFKSLSIDYSAGVNAIIDEPDGIIDGEIDTDEEKSYIFSEIKNLGRMKNFDQDISATYRTPLNKLPFTDWLSVDLKYAAGYSWIAGSLSQNDSLGNFYGHTIMNSRNKGATGKIDMNKLYNKVTFLKAANSPKRGEEVSASSKFLQFMMALKSINVTYNVREGTTLPGFTKTPFLMGMDSSWNAPGWAFLLGDQNPDIRYKAARNGWLSESPFLTTPFEQNFGTDISVRASLEPLKDLKIQLDAARANNANYQEIFRFDSANVGNENNGFASLTPARSGSYSISVLTIKTAFKKNKSDYSNANFDQFVENIEIMRTRQNLENGNLGEYDSLSQDVIIPAFLAAYTGKNASTSSTNPFPRIPLPNWRIDYTGLTKIPALAEAFSSITISHGYRSVYNVNNYSNSLQYSDNISLDNNILNYPQASLTNDSGVYVPVYIINQVSIAEQFTPLIGVNVRTKNNLSTKFEYKRGRNLSLQTSNGQISETLNQDYTFDLGFTKSDFKLPFKVKGRTVGIENDVTFRMALTLRDSETVQRSINTGSKIQNGNTSFQFRPTIAYKFNAQLDLMAYFERTVNEPKVSTFKTATTAFGFQLRFSLAQ